MTLFAARGHGQPPKQPDLTVLPRKSHANALYSLQSFGAVARFDLFHARLSPPQARSFAKSRQAFGENHAARGVVPSP